jgi:hypothetical protein
VINQAVKYPDVVVQLTGQDGNAFLILGLVRRALSKAEVPQSEIDAFMAEATAGDYNNLLSTCMRWVEVI